MINILYEPERLPIDLEEIVNGDASVLHGLQEGWVFRG
jgi:hypothetical protein